MSSTITNLHEKRVEKEAQTFGETVVNNALNDMPNLLTQALSDVLEHSSQIIYFSGGDDRATQGQMERTDAPHLIEVSQNQDFRVESLPELNTFKLVFDDDHQYAVHLNKDVSKTDFHYMLEALLQERMDNLLVANERERRIFSGMLNSSKDTSWMTKNFENGGLHILLNSANTLIQGTYDDGVAYHAVDPQDIATLAQKQLYNATFDPETRTFSLSFLNEGQSFFKVSMPPHYDRALVVELADIIKEERTLNFAYRRNNDPSVEEMRQRFENAPPIELDDELKAFLADTVEEKPDEDKPLPDNVTSLSRRSR